MNAYIESPFDRKSDDTPSTGSSVRRGSEKKRRVKMADLRAFVETRMFSKSDRALERVGLDLSTGNDNRDGLGHSVSDSIIYDHK